MIFKLNAIKQSYEWQQLTLSICCEYNFYFSFIFSSCNNSHDFLVISWNIFFVQYKRMSNNSARSNNIIIINYAFASVLQSCCFFPHSEISYKIGRAREKQRASNDLNNTNISRHFKHKWNTIRNCESEIWSFNNFIWVEH